MSNQEKDPQGILCQSGRSPEHEEEGTAVEIISSRDVPLGGPRAMTVHRTLPQKKRSLIGAWCFVDHYGPDDVSLTGGMDVAPHPHTGLQTVSWLFQGEIEHIDSGDNRGLVRPAELNVMTSGAGICHSEVSTPDTRVLHGVQLWLALPSGARHTAPRQFEHYEPEIHRIPGGEIIVFLGDLAGQSSPVTTFTPVVGAEIRIDAHCTIELEVNESFEHGVLVDSGTVSVAGVTVAPTYLAYTGVGEHTLTLCNEGDTPARLLLIGGTPFGEEIVMWWNFVGRNDDEIRQFRQSWENRTEQFGHVRGYVGHGGPGKNADGMSWLPAPRLPNARIKPRRNPDSVANSR